MGNHQAIRICHVISGDLWAGAEIQACLQLRGLRAAGEFELSAVVLNPGRLAEELKAAGIDTTVLDERRHGFPSLVRQMRTRLTARPVDILHSHRYKENLLAALLRKSNRPVRLVQTVHGLGEMFTGFRWAKAQLYSAVDLLVTRRSFDRIIAVSEDIRSRLAPRFGSDRVVTVRNAVDLDRVRTAKSPSAVRNELNLPEDCPLLGAAGRLVPIKGFDLFMHMAAIIHRDLPSARFVLMGDGPLKSELERQASLPSLGGVVAVTGYRNDVWDVLAALDLFVISSHHEGIPVVLLEAMALERAVVATAVGGVPEVIVPDSSGLLVPPGDAGALASACLSLLRDQSAREKLGRSAAERIRSEFSVASVVARIGRLYRDLAAP